MSEHWSLPIYDKGKPKFLLHITFFCVIPLLVCHLDYYIWKYLKSYTVCMSYCYTEYLYLLLKFCHCDNLNTAFGSCGYFNLPTVRSQRQPIFQDTLACTYSLVGLVQLLELGTKTGRVNAQLLGALNTASRYIVAFIFEHVADAAGTLTAAAPSIRACASVPCGPDA